MPSWFNDIQLSLSSTSAYVGDETVNETDTTAETGLSNGPTNENGSTNSWPDRSPSAAPSSESDDQSTSTLVSNQTTDVLSSTTSLLASDLSLLANRNGSIVSTSGNGTTIVPTNGGTAATSDDENISVPSEQLLFTSDVTSIVSTVSNGTVAVVSDNSFSSTTSITWENLRQWVTASSGGSTHSQQHFSRSAAATIDLDLTTMAVTLQPSTHRSATSGNIVRYASSGGGSKVTLIASPDKESWTSASVIQQACNARITVLFDGDCPSVAGDKLMADVFSIQNKLFLETQLSISRADVTIEHVKCDNSESVVVFAFRVELNRSRWLSAKKHLHMLVMKRLWNITINRSQYTFDFSASAVFENCSLFSENAYTHSVPLDSDEMTWILWPWVALPRLKHLIVIAACVVGGILLCLLLSCTVCAIVRRKKRHQKAAFNISTIAEESWSDITLEKMHRSIPVYCEPGVIFVDLDSNDIVDRSVLQQASAASASLSRQQAQAPAPTSSDVDYLRYNRVTSGMDCITVDVESERDHSRPRTTPLGVSSSEPFERASSFDNHSFIRDESLS